MTTNMTANFSEVIVASTNLSCAVIDCANGNVIESYKEGDISPKSLNMIGEDYFIAGIKDKPLLKVWMVNRKKREKTGSFPCCGVVTCLAVSPCGSFCVASMLEQIYIWQVNTGELLNIFSRHFQEIACLKFSLDSAYIVSGGKCGNVVIWHLSEVISSDQQDALLKPYRVWTEHNGEVTDLYSGALGSVSRIASASMDMTCRIYEPDSGLLLTTICLEEPITSIVMDSLEFNVYLGTINGFVYQINLYEKMPVDLHLGKDTTNYKVHDSRITSIKLSFDETKLLTASEDGFCKIYKVGTMSNLLIVPCNGSITNAFLTLMPKPLSNGDILPKFPLNTFSREYASEGKEGTHKLDMCSSLISKPLSLFHEFFPDEHYSSEVLNGCTKAVCTDSADPEQIHNESVFQEAFTGGTVNDLKSVNNQLYSYLINSTMQSFQNP